MLGVVATTFVKEARSNMVSGVIASRLGERARAPKAFWWIRLPSWPIASTAPVIPPLSTVSWISVSTAEKFTVSFALTGVGFFFRDAEDAAKELRLTAAIRSSEGIDRGNFISGLSVL
jgi:hypothetical protein